MILLSIVNILIPAAIIIIFLKTPAAAILGEASRILYFHVPLAWLSVLGFISAAFYSVRCLMRKEPDDSFKLYNSAHNSAILGLFFTVMTVITGSIWAKISWGSFWNWDPRETSIAALLLIYIAYSSLHQALKEHPSQHRICSAYLIIAAVTVPFFVFIIPRLYPSLHPDTIINPEKKIHLDSSMRLTLAFSGIAFTFLYIYLLKTLNRISELNKKIQDHLHE